MKKNNHNGKRPLTIKLTLAEFEALEEVKRIQYPDLSRHKVAVMCFINGLEELQDGN